jgi:hypothetical protein
MSYDINAYQFLGIKVIDSVNSLEYDRKVDINSDDPNIFVKLDKKYAKLLDSNKSLLSDSKFSELDNMTVQGFMDINSRSADGPTGTFIRSLLIASGIRHESFYKTDLVLGMLFDVEFLPQKFTPVLYKSSDSEPEVQNCGIVEVNNKFLAELIRGLADSGDLNVQDPRKSSGTYIIPCFRKALENLLKMHESAVKAKESASYEGMNKIYAFEKWMNRLINNLSCNWGYDCKFDVVSSFYGDLFREGGMERNIPYIVFDELYSIESWEDPREVCPENLAEAKSLILAEDSPIEWQLFSPQFGG